jgi:ubiquinone/menaquinone biosynthesis C-methylase UbiE
LDLDQKTLDMVSDDLVKEKVCADACKMPYKDKFFDVVIAFDIFEHIFDDKKAAEEVKRVLKKEGVLFVTVPAFSFLYSVHDRMTGHVRRYNKRQVRALFKDFKQSLFGFWFFSLFFLAVLQRLFTKKKTTSDFYQQKTPKLIHRILYKIVTLDNWLIRKGVSFPWGLTIYGVYRNL